MTGYTEETQAEVIRVNKEISELFGHMYGTDEYYQKGWEYTLANVSPSAREELLKKEKNPSP